jgi:hypothetical protein
MSPAGGGSAFFVRRFYPHREMSDEKTHETRVFVPLNQRFANPHTWPNIVGYLVGPLAEMPWLIEGTWDSFF